MLKNKKVTILDYNAGNILSVKRAFEYCGANVQIKNKPKDMKKEMDGHFMLMNLLEVKW